MHDFLVHGELLSDNCRCQGCIMRDQAEDARIGLPAHPPHMQVGDPRVTGVRTGLHRLPDLLDNGVIHFTVEQDLRSFGQEVPGPERYKPCADNAHDGIEPRPAVEQAAGQRDDCENGGGGIGDYMQVR